MEKLVYSFSEAQNFSKEILGGKGYGLVQMSSIGFPVPPGFIVTTEACKNYYSNGKVISDDLKKQILDAISNLELFTSKKFYSLSDQEFSLSPLLLSARSGAKVSMPGMMDTILNIGITPNSFKFIADQTGDYSFTNDIYLRFLQMFTDVYAHVPKSDLSSIIESSDSFESKIVKIKSLYNSSTHSRFPDDPYDQLFMAIEAVFNSWNNDRAIFYRKSHGLSENDGTAVAVQMMVFGNFFEKSGTGVAFSRNPSNGNKELFGEYLMRAQGEDVVAGIRTPLPISKMKDDLPDVYDQLSKFANILENHFNDMQDMEFTIEQGKLYILQTRSGKRSPLAAVRISLDFLNENKISEQESVNRVSPNQIQLLLHPSFDQNSLENFKLISKGLPASPGAAVGKAVFDSESAYKYHSQGEKVILIRQETSAEDVEGMAISEGILTVHGGMTSHAAVVARGMGKCCVSGCEEILINDKSLVSKDVIINEGDFISIDGSSGNIYAGQIPLKDFEFSDDVIKFLNISDNIGRIKVMANADTPESVSKAIELGACGVGLCRTEHMFFGSDRINFMRKMIFSKDEEERQESLDKLFEFQKDDFSNMFVSSNGKNITIRLLDPPLHEFLPKSDVEINDLSEYLGISIDSVIQRSNELKEFNPMMGHRGCRLLISYPEIAIMQTRAIIQSAIDVSKKIRTTIVPEIMIPLVGSINEIKFLKKIICEVADNLIDSNQFDLEYKIGTMIETPRAAIISDELAKEVDFFSFGTNDLTQMTFGFSRDDSQKFLKDYKKFEIYQFDPFANIDVDGVGKLIEMSINLGRSVNPELKIGVCGEHAGDPISIKFFRNLDIDYISCSPFRVPVARLAVSQKDFI